MAEFKRQLRQETIERLKGEQLFSEKLCPDILQGFVFPAIRNEYVDFYYRGGRLFTFNSKQGFRTHIKYASVLKSQSKDPYVSQDDMRTSEMVIKDFGEAYERIKENCLNYSGIEAEGVSTLYSKFSYADTIKHSDIVVLDIEVSFKSGTEGKDQDRIDLLLFNKKKNSLRFYEAKHFSNKEIWAKEGIEPKVANQIKRYQEQIGQRKIKILDAYGQYCDLVNAVFDFKIDSPKELDEAVGLLIFGFDSDQLKGRFKRLLLDDRSLEGIKIYTIGDVSTVKIENLWSNTK